MFTVYDTGKKADCFHNKVDSSWDKCSFDTKQEAIEYAKNWLGMYDSTSIDWDGSKHIYYATEYGECFIEVVEE